MLGDEQGQIVVVTCPECGAIGLRPTGDDPPGHAAYLWNQRFGQITSRAPPVPHDSCQCDGAISWHPIARIRN